jgi:hypothetical protein
VPDRFAAIVRQVCLVLGERLGRHPAYALAWPVLWRRLTFVARRFAVLAAQREAGALPPPRRSPARPVLRAQPSRPRLCFPRRFGWLRAMGPPGAAMPFAGALERLLHEPQTAALIEAAPQLRAYLRPLCRMLGVPPTDALALPPRPSRRRPPVPSSPPPPRSAAPKPTRACLPGGRLRSRLGTNAVALPGSVSFKPA